MSKQAPDSLPAAVGAWTRLLRAHAATSRTLSAKLLADHGLTINDYEALSLLARAEDGRLRRVDLAARLLLTASGVTRLLDGLEQLGLVRRADCPSDRRVSYAELTASGADVLEKAACAHVRAVTELVERHLDADEIDTLTRLLGKLPGVAACTGETAADALACGAAYEEADA